jgi:hypothetical protein
MSVYPFAIDDDTTIIRVDDNITEIGEEAVNQLRDAVFSLEESLGINPASSAGDVATRLNKSLTADGDIKASALTSIGLVSLPITNSQVGVTAGIQESKLSLDYSTADLYAQIQSNKVLLNTLQGYSLTTRSDLLVHISGASILSDGSAARHVASHIDINAVPNDPRDLPFIWTGLINKDGYQLAAANVAEALEEINNTLTGHQNQVTDAHTASAISVDTDNFTELSHDSDNVQKALEELDQAEILNMGMHRATKHANAIPTISRSQSPILPDGYRENVVEITPAIAYLVRPVHTEPVDSVVFGDDVIRFVPTNTDFKFDAQFSQVKVGDIIRINYGNGVEASFPIESIRFSPGSEWCVRINGYNLYNSTGATARIDRARYDENTYGVLALAAVNATPIGIYNYLTSIIMSSPRGATALGIGFDPNQLDTTHYKLYLELYPSGNPEDHIVSLPFIDVTGNAGATPGQYTLDSIIQTTNDNLRETGYNYRLIAFEYNGEFGLKLADAINNSSFAIIAGVNNGGIFNTGIYTENVIGGMDITTDDFDALGLGQNHANLASPSYQSTFSDSTEALLPTKVLVPLKERNYIVNGARRDSFAPTYAANDDGYWDGYITARNEIGATVETTYLVPLDLKAAGLKEGKTIVVQPAVGYSDALYSDVDYGRFIINSVQFNPYCPGVNPDQTYITVLNSIHAQGAPVAASGMPGLPVRLYFSEDSVGFNQNNMVDSAATPDNYHRHHEIFVTDTGKTFSHERARMIYQAGAAPLLDTTAWHIIEVSPKLRGYKDLATSANKYVRFEVLSYDATSGEYTGYIGKRDAVPQLVTQAGPITTGRKNVTCRFYDETNIDYIDVLFEETGVAFPGTAITPLTYVDIEIFDSLRTDDEFLLAGTCEINWDPATGQNVVERVRDHRQFGSVDEKDFTNSAVDFINAGERYLHANGIVRGFTLDYISPAPNNKEIFYKGGIALVNGSICTVNNCSVTIPELYNSLGPIPPPAVPVDWAICVNENGKLIPILLTTTKTQYFATDGVTTYYVPSVTFLELVNNRKDLTPIAVVTANIASVTITASDIQDVRKLIYNETANNQLVLSSEDISGNFHTFESLANWMRNYGQVGSSRVVVRGSFQIDAEVDLTGIDCPMIFEGDGTLIQVTSTKGFLVDSNIAFRDMVFTYDPPAGDPPAIVYTAGDYINLGNACIYSAPGTDLSNIEINHCVFFSSLTTQRPPFVSLEMERDGLANSIIIRDCHFGDYYGDGYQAAVAIYGNSLGTGTLPSTLVHTSIDHCSCNSKQGIYVISNWSVLNRAGLSCIDVNISNNICGVIGMAITSEVNDYVLAAAPNRNSGLLIKNNTCHFIGSVTKDGVGLFGSGHYSTNISTGMGFVNIESNNANWIHIVNQDGDSTSPTSSVNISNNILRAFSPTYLKYRFYNGYAPTINRNYAIIIYSALSGRDLSTCNISGNNINRDGEDAFGQTFLYYGGMYITASAIISGNSINGFEFGSELTGNNLNSGIYVVNGITGEYRNIIITNNKIYRETRDIERYIGADPSFSTWIPYTNIYDNYFDSYTVDAALTDEEVISSLGLTSGNFSADKNINQTCYAYVLDAFADPINVGASTLDFRAIYRDYSAFYYEANGVNTESRIEGLIDLTTLLPNNVWIIDITCSASYTAADAPTTCYYYANVFSGAVLKKAIQVDMAAAGSGVIASETYQGGGGTPYKSHFTYGPTLATSKRSVITTELRIDQSAITDTTIMLYHVGIKFRW